MLIIGLGHSTCDLPFTAFIFFSPLAIPIYSVVAYCWLFFFVFFYILFLLLVVISQYTALPWRIRSDVSPPQVEGNLCGGWWVGEHCSIRQHFILIIQV